MSEDLERATAFAWALQDRTSTRIEPSPWGHALYNDDIPQRWYSNFVRVERSLVGVEVADVLAEVDRALAAFGHRQLQVFDESDGERIALGLAEAGYTADHSATMALRRPPDRGADLSAVVELDYDEARPFLLEVYRRELPGDPPDVIRRFAEHRRTVQRAAAGRFFARRIDGTMAGLCELYLDDGLGQVEHVDTLEEFRGRGVARSVVLRAIHEAHATGADLVIIEADLDDWPIELYRRFGFDEIGRTWSFTKAPSSP